jgi:hypothetical protein
MLLAPWCGYLLGFLYGTRFRHIFRGGRPTCPLCNFKLQPRFSTWRRCGARRYVKQPFKKGRKKNAPFLLAYNFAGGGNVDGCNPFFAYYFIRCGEGVTKRLGEISPFFWVVHQKNGDPRLAPPPPRAVWLPGVLRWGSGISCLEFLLRSLRWGGGVG